MRQSVALLLIPLFALPFAARATETFQAKVSQHLTVPGGCDPKVVSYFSHAAPGGVSQTCGDFTGVAGGTAFAASGQVGASANATDVTSPFVSDSFAAWSDDHVVITKIGNPAAGGTTTASRGQRMLLDAGRIERDGSFIRATNARATTQDAASGPSAEA